MFKSSWQHIAVEIDVGAAPRGKVTIDGIDTVRTVDAGALAPSTYQRVTAGASSFGSSDWIVRYDSVFCDR